MSINRVKPAWMTPELVADLQEIWTLPNLVQGLHKAEHRALVRIARAMRPETLPEQLTGHQSSFILHGGLRNASVGARWWDRSIGTLQFYEALPRIALLMPSFREPLGTTDAERFTTLYEDIYNFAALVYPVEIAQKKKRSPRRGIEFHIFSSPNRERSITITKGKGDELAHGYIRQKHDDMYTVELEVYGEKWELLSCHLLSLLGVNNFE